MERRRDRLIQEKEHDSYKTPTKLPDPSACPDCGAMYRNGRWLWGSPPADAHRALCPACHRARDGYPAGELRLAGAFALEHREEVLGLARNVEQREKDQHPLKRIMTIADEEGAIRIETTDVQLARSIGDALHRAYQGELDYRYEKAEKHIRVTWSRGEGG